MKKVAIMQSNYLPWRGYFHLIDSVDEFILLDNVQFTRRDWRNRNRMLVNGEPRWLTIPLNQKGCYKANIDEVYPSEPNWNKIHLDKLCFSYRNAPYFSEKTDLLEALYCIDADQNLSSINQYFLTVIMRYLGIKTKLSQARTLDVTATEKNDRLIALCKAVNATHYVVTPKACAYIAPDKFSDQGIALEYFQYPDYGRYPQTGLSASAFYPNLSIIDYLLSVPEAELVQRIFQTSDQSDEAIALPTLPLMPKYSSG